MSFKKTTTWTKQILRVTDNPMHQKTCSKAQLLTKFVNNMKPALRTHCSAEATKGKQTYYYFFFLDNRILSTRAWKILLVFVVFDHCAGINFYIFMTPSRHTKEVCDITCQISLIMKFALHLNVKNSWTSFFLLEKMRMSIKWQYLQMVLAIKKAKPRTVLSDVHISEFTVHDT